MMLILLTPGIDLHCSRHEECDKCVSSTTWSSGPCRWCPLDRSCHAKWSPRNHCLTLRHHSIRDISQCNAHSSGNFTYNEDDAYNLALFSAIAYSDVQDTCLSALLPDSDYTIFATYFRDCDDFLFDYNQKCSALIAYSHRNKEIIVAYRGTRGMEQIIDQILVTIAIPAVPCAIGGKVQRYFDNVYRTFYHSIKYMIQDLRQWFPNYKVKFTGHSLGGATASITSAMLVKDKVLQPEDVSLYTFGMPRVGNKLYALAHDKLVPDSWRVVRKGDIVTRLPMCHLTTCSIFNGPYHHGTKVVYIEDEMDLDSDYVICKGNEDHLSECMDQTREKRSAPFGSIMDKHKMYFGIPIGTYCRDHILI